MWSIPEVDVYEYEILDTGCWILVVRFAKIFTYIKSNYPGCQVQGSQFRGSTWSHEPLSMPRVLNRLMKNPHLTVNGSANNH